MSGSPSRLGVSLLLAAPAFACVCRGYEPVRACNAYSKNEVVFRGRVIGHDGDPDRKRFGKATLHRFAVLEAFKGLPEGMKQVFIDPLAWSDCGASFRDGVEYLLFVNPGSVQIGGLPLFLAGSCSPIKEVTANDPDLAYLRSVRNLPDGAPGSIEGSAAPALDERFPGNGPGVRDAVAILRSGSIERRAAAAPDGSYRFDGIPPGPFELRIESPSLGPAVPDPEADAKLPPGGCAIVNVSYAAQVRVSGVVRMHNGEPAVNIPVEAAQLQESGPFRIVRHATSRTDSLGRFELRGLPVGRVVAGVRLSRPADTVYAPGVRKLSEARTFYLRPGGEWTGADIVLPKGMERRLRDARP